MLHTAIATPIAEYTHMADAPRLRIELPDDERGRAPDTIRRFEKLQRKLLNPKLTPKERDAVLAELRQIETAPATRADDAWARSAVSESEKLAEARGETVADDKGIRRIMDRDPLLTLARSGKITADQMEVGEKVRDLYDRRAEALASVPFSGMPGAAHNHEAFVARAYSRAKATEMVDRIERKVFERYQLGAVEVLRAICRDGRALRTMSPNGRTFDRNAVALGKALDLADLVLRRQA